MKTKRILFSLICCFLVLSTGFISCNTETKTKEVDVEKEAVYTVTYFSLAGEVPAAIQLKYGSKLTAENLPALEAEGYVFEGWFINGEPAQEGYVVQKNITITAKWSPKKYTLTFVDNLGTGTTPNQIFTYNVVQAIGGSKATAPIGYYFHSWNTKADGSGMTYYAGDVIKLTADLTLYAIYYEKNMHSIVYVSEVEIETPVQNTFKEKDIVVLDAPNAVVGYIFNGWYETSDFSTDKIEGWAAGEKTENVVVYAKWTPVKFTVKYNGNNGLASEETQIFEYGVPSTVIKNTFEKKGYIFKCWNTKPDGSGESYAEDTNAVIYSTQDITLYAKWEIVTYKISFELNGGYLYGTPIADYNINSGVISLPVPYRTGYTFDGWYLNNTFEGSPVETKIAGITGNIEYFAKWTAKTYTITFKPNGGEGNEYTQTIAYDETKNLLPNAFTKAGYHFLKWETSPSEAGDTYGDEKAFRVDKYNPHDVTLYAYWSMDTYYITYELPEDAVNHENNVDSYDLNTYVVVLCDPSRAGYTFDGWYLDVDEDTGIFYNPVSAFEVSKTLENVKLYSKWTANTNTRFEINYFIEHLDDSEYEMFDYDYGYGVTDTEPSAGVIESKVLNYEIPGFTLAHYDEILIKGDGSSVLNVYLNRKIITYQFVTNGAEFTDYCDIQDFMIVGKYGLPIQISDLYLAGEYFNGWICTKSPETIIASSEIIELGPENLMFKASFTKANVISISIESLSDIGVTYEIDGAAFTFTTSEDFDVYTWIFDGSTIENDSNTYIVDSTGLISGVYELYVEAVKADEYGYVIENTRRSATIFIIVQ